MGTTERIVCHAFLQRCAPSKRDSLLKFLPEKESQALLALPSFLGDPTVESSLTEQLSVIHSSWFAPFLRALPENEIRLFLSALEEPQAKNLKKILLFANSLPHLTSPAKRFLQKVLYESLLSKEEEILPLSCLPNTPLNMLLSLREGEWPLLFDLLGLYDLAIEMPLIIETAKLKHIHSFLSKEESAYLKAILQKKTPPLFQRMALDRWDGKGETLRMLLQQRGINRMAKALYGEHPSFIWHIEHRLEMGCAAILKKLLSSLENANAVSLLRQQLEETFRYLKTQKPPSKTS